MLTKVLTVRDEIAEYWNARPTAASAVFASDDDYAAFYTSKYLIQDTGESIFASVVEGFSDDHMTAYIQFWGVMQALIIQQDAICELHKSLLGKPPAVPTASAWQELRDFRNRCAGHPANKSVKGGTVRTFMGRMFGDYDAVTYEQYDSKANASTGVTVNLRSMILGYDAQAEQYMLAALAELKRKCP